MFGLSKNGASNTAKIFVVTVCVVIALLETWSAMRERDVKLAESTRATSNVAMALAQHADQTFNQVDIVLLGLLERLERDGQSGAGLERTHDMMVMRVRSLPQLAGLFVYDEHGRWIVNSQQTLETRFNNADRDYFIYHRDHRSEKPFIGKPIRSKSNGQWILTISRRINKIDGSFGGVVLGTIDLAFLQRFYERFDIGREGAIMLGNLDGTILHRRPLLPDSIGKRLDNSPLFRDHVRHHVSGEVEIRSVQDGILRIQSFQHLADHPLFVVVAMSRNEVLAEWRSHVWARALGVALLLLVLCYGGARMVAQVRGREVAERDAVGARKELEQLYQALEEQAQKDGLTAVFNRRYFDQALHSELARLGRTGGTLSLIMVDVDNFKMFNDTYGHAAGDVCLQKVAATLSHAAQRKHDVVARYGGEEFAVLLPDCDSSCALGIAQAMMARLRKQRITHAHGVGGIVTASVGVASLTAPGGLTITPRDLIEVADEALYVAKHQGRDRISFRAFPASDGLEGLFLTEQAD
ncbi:sensor domain-containing diguanylate cyclase [Herbaspirillum sp. YR522]|uniref:sensor domain-containing diguanylate cyclase n=1 Tax=Herbaspirillum sp. YR522 TaxID=1144342 RepID=UPI00026FB327|nr:sensor domain-containing diguanylate cyclase [Herbaspirillum sp. YR522]EJN08817.1 diguanylate cyclase (GGDEF) domain-containing protein [Herbaspirillum sp. YR522]